MNCSQWEERIALYAGGDLPAAEAAEVNGHLAECPGCQIFASGLKESLEWMQAAHREPISEAHFAAVRARVLAELAERSQPWWRSAWVYGFASAALALLLILTLVPRKTAQAPQVAVHVPAVVEQVPVETPAAGTPPARIHRAHAVPRHAKPILPVEALPEPGPPVVVKMLTDDPDVVIYWITDNPGE